MPVLVPGGVLRRGVAGLLAHERELVVPVAAAASAPQIAAISVSGAIRTVTDSSSRPWGKPAKNSAHAWGATCSGGYESETYTVTDSPVAVSSLPPFQPVAAAAAAKGVRLASA